MPETSESKARCREMLERIFKADARAKEEAEALSRISPNQTHTGARHLYPHATDMMEVIRAHHAALKRCVEALDAAKDKLHRECGGQREYTGGIPTQTLFPLIDQALAELKEIL